MMENRFLIGHLASVTGCKVQTIRYYEQIGLLSPPHRTSGNQRLYGPEAVDRLQFIRHARQLGFSLDAIGELLSLSDQPDKSCKTADKIARLQLAEVEERISRLQTLRVELMQMISDCSCGTVSECTIVEALRDPADGDVGTDGHLFR